MVKSVGVPFTRGALESVFTRLHPRPLRGLLGRALLPTPCQGPLPAALKHPGSSRLGLQGQAGRSHLCLPDCMPPPHPGRRTEKPWKPRGEGKGDRGSWAGGGCPCRPRPPHGGPPGDAQAAWGGREQQARDWPGQQPGWPGTHGGRERCRGRLPKAWYLGSG